MRQRQRLVDGGCERRIRVAHDLVDRDEAGVLREQAVLQAELGDRVLLRAAAFERFLIAERADALACPQMAQCGRGLVLAAVARDLVAVRAVGAAAFDHHLAGGVAAPFAEHHHRTPAQQVGQLRRFDVVDIEPLEARLHLREHRRVDHPAQPLGL